MNFLLDKITKKCHNKINTKTRWQYVQTRRYRRKSSKKINLKVA